MILIYELGHELQRFFNMDHPTYHLRIIVNIEDQRLLGL